MSKYKNPVPPEFTREQQRLVEKIVDGKTMGLVNALAELIVRVEKLEKPQ